MRVIYTATAEKRVTSIIIFVTLDDRSEIIYYVQLGPLYNTVETVAR